MIDNIKASLTNALVILIQDYGDPSSIDRKDIEDKGQFRIEDLFSKQHVTDKVKKRLGNEITFNKAVALYLNRFLTRDGVDAYLLKQELNAYKKPMSIHLDKNLLRFLRLITTLIFIIDEPKEKPRGLLAS